MLLFVNFSTELDAFKLYKDVAIYYKVDGLRFLLGDVEVGTAAFNVSSSILSAYLISNIRFAK